MKIFSVALFVTVLVGLLAGDIAKHRNEISLLQGGMERAYMVNGIQHDQIGQLERLASDPTEPSK